MECYYLELACCHYASIGVIDIIRLLVTQETNRVALSTLQVPIIIITIIFYRGIFTR